MNPKMRNAEQGREILRISGSKIAVYEAEFENIVGKVISWKFRIPENVAIAIAGRYQELEAKRQQGIYDPWSRAFMEENREIVEYIHINFEIVWD